MAMVVHVRIWLRGQINAASKLMKLLIASDEVSDLPPGVSHGRGQRMTATSNINSALRTTPPPPGDRDLQRCAVRHRRNGQFGSLDLDPNHTRNRGIGVPVTNSVNCACFIRPGVWLWLARSLVKTYSRRFVLLRAGIPQHHLGG